MIGEELIIISNLAQRAPHVLGSSVTVDFLIAPILLFYAWSITDRDRAFVRRDLLHLVPFALAILTLLPFYTSSGDEKLRLLESGLRASFRVVITARSWSLPFISPP